MDHDHFKRRAALAGEIGMRRKFLMAGEEEQEDMWSEHSTGKRTYKTAAANCTVRHRPVQNASGGILWFMPPDFCLDAPVVERNCSDRPMLISDHHDQIGALLK